MSGGEFDAQYAVLERAASQHAAVASRASGIRAQAQVATLAGGALGKLPQSQAIEHAFNQRHHAAVEALANLAEVYDNIADGLKLTVEQYRTADESVEDTFRRAGGGSVR